MVIGYFDRGKHYDSEAFLFNRLVDWPKKHKKNYALQFLEGGHGKKLVDGNVFGQKSWWKFVMRSSIRMQKLLYPD